MTAVFDRSDTDTMRVVDAAIRAARELGHRYIGTEHLLLGMAEHRDLLPPPVGSLLPEVETVRSAISSIIGEPARSDAELLSMVGIDLDEVRAAVRRTFGNDVMDAFGSRSVHQPWQPWRRPSRRCSSLLAGNMMVMPRVKQAFDGARRDAQRRQRRSIDPAGLLLGMVDVEDALANRLLREHGVDPQRIRKILVGAESA